MKFGDTQGTLTNVNPFGQWIDAYNYPTTNNYFYQITFTTTESKTSQAPGLTHQLIMSSSNPHNVLVVAISASIGSAGIILISAIIIVAIFYVRQYWIPISC